MSGLPAVATLFKILYLQDCAFDLHAVFTEVVALFSKSWLQPDSAHLGVTLTGSACRVKGVNIDR